MSTRSKGRAFETWGRDYLREHGWDVHLCGRKAVMLGPGKMVTKGDDIFGSDLVAVKPGELTLFVQLTCDSNLKKRLEEFKRHGFEPAHQRVELWQKRSGGAVVVHAFQGGALIETGRIIRGRFYQVEGQGEGSAS